MIDRSSFLTAVYEVGSGNASYPMKRGSFKHSEKILWRHRLKSTGTERTPEGILLKLTEPKTGKSGSILLTEEGKEEGKLLHIHPEFSAFEADRLWITLPADADEHIYGCGETFSEFDLKGKKVRIWVAEHQNSDRIAKKILRDSLLGKKPERKLPFDRYESYYAQPTFVSSECYFVHVDGNAYMDFDFRKPDHTVLYMRQIPDIIIGKADSFPELSRLLSGLLGRPRRLPEWIFDGFIGAIQQGTDVLDRHFAEAQQAGLPLCGVWSQDWCGCRRTKFGYQVMWNWHYDESLYPNLPEQISRWKTRGIHFLGYINPFMAIEKDLYAYASAHGYCVKDKDGKDYLVTITTFPAAMIDLTNPEAYEWYKSIIKENMIGIGMSGWMADFGEYLPTDAVLHSGESAEKLHNRWPAIWAGLNREAIRECGAEDEVFFFTRAGYTETIRNSDMMWTGDQHVDWSIDDGIGSVIPASLSLAMSGFTLTHSDVGGYTTMGKRMHRSRELLMRWAEMNAFTPLMRSHEGNQPVNNVQFYDDADLLAFMARVTKLHVMLAPYLKEVQEEAISDGIPAMRPLFYHYDEAEAYTCDQEYLLGRDILVAPVLTEHAATRTCYLPQDTWVHLFTGKTWHGGHVTLQAPPGTPPVFVRKSSPYLTELLEKAMELG